MEIAAARDDWDYNNDVTLTLTATDDDPGQASKPSSTLSTASPTRSAPTAWTSFHAVPNGVHTVVFYARDVAGNEGPDETFRITMDTGGPVGYGHNASVRKGRYVSLRYLFRDTDGGHIWNVKVKVKNRSGRTVWSKRLGC